MLHPCPTGPCADGLIGQHSACHRPAARPLPPPGRAPSRPPHGHWLGDGARHPGEMVHVGLSAHRRTAQMEQAFIVAVGHEIVAGRVLEVDGGGRVIDDGLPPLLARPHPLLRLLLLGDVFVDQVASDGTRYNWANMGVSAGASTRRLSSSSSFITVTDAPAISNEVTYSPT